MFMVDTSCLVKMQALWHVILVEKKNIDHKVKKVREIPCVSQLLRLWILEVWIQKKKKGTSYTLVQDVHFIYEYSLKNGPEHDIVFKLCHLDFLALFLNYKL